MYPKPIGRCLFAAAFLCLIPTLHSQTSDSSKADELAKKLSNPVASLISVPFQSNFDFGAGPDGDGFKYTLNTQPVIPISVNEDWNLISRTILPYVYQEDIVEDGGHSQTGFSDTVQSFFLSPKKPGPNGAIWGVGPVLLLPTAGNDSLGAEKWGAGPTAVLLYQKGPWTYGTLVNHLWSFAGKDKRSDVNATFIQPFASWGGLGGGQTLTANIESTYDWESEQWTVPLNCVYSKVTQVGNQLVQFSLGARVYLDAPDNGPDWGLRAMVTLLFPK
ncbi:hypothetical protein [Coraliomargarita parva]|uniref:hypothetical protein n=1 Tax=Coraliomargarita parva TaxID=3014050 RepID=UPI0031F2D8C7